ncbi:MAG TPA: hypothetical protein VF399_09835 [bacterium]
MSRRACLYLGVIVCMALMTSCQSIDKAIDDEYAVIDEQNDNSNGPNRGIDDLEPSPPVVIPESLWYQYDFHELSDEEIDSLYDAGLGDQDESPSDGWSAKAWAVSWGSLFWKLEYCGASTKKVPMVPPNVTLYLYTEIWSKLHSAQNYTLRKVGGPSETSCVYKCFVWLFLYSKSQTQDWWSYGKHRCNGSGFVYTNAYHTH